MSLALTVGAAVAGAEETRPVTAAAVEFPRPSALAPRIDFWKSIFTRYAAQQILIHDAEHVDKVYTVLDLRGASDKEVARASADEKRRVQAILRHLDTVTVPDGARLTGEHKRIFEMFRNVSEPRKFLAASERVRGQAGLQERFGEGIRVSRRYLPEMEAIFRAEGLPIDLTRLPMIESCFDVRAYSWRGAAGIWQFMPATGRLHGLRVDRLIDERRDPLRATRAAAGYLREAYAALGTWPLAITSYNHGIRGIARGVDTVGTKDIAVLIDEYRGRGFGFAGQNFYPEFLAALEVDRGAERYFGPLGVEPPPPTEEVLLEQPISVEIAAQEAGVARADLVAYNPSFASAVAAGDAAIPRAYRLRLPAGAGSPFRKHIDTVRPADPPPEAHAGVHKVGSGQTLSQIATRYGASMSALMRHNGIRNPDMVRQGQLLSIPEGSGARRFASVSPRYIRHRVQRGQTLSQIAERYGTSVGVLQRQNGIRNPRRLRVGQIVKVPAG